MKLHKQSLLSESVPGSRHPQFSEIQSMFYLKSCSLFTMFTESRMNKEAKTKLPDITILQQKMQLCVLYSSFT